MGRKYSGEVWAVAMVEKALPASFALNGRLPFNINLDTVQASIIMAKI